MTNLHLRINATAIKFRTYGRDPGSLRPVEVRVLPELPVPDSSLKEKHADFKCFNDLIRYNGRLKMQNCQDLPSITASLWIAPL